ncbi:uncharacterized protein LOC128994435 isoform X1 [Macrosteles quadrilineatus]|uniref:uncharacterized protein LOC128994435 isoform X1 n=1 Tax=Macrosteles quadrilineatus TaxID=74068 RepID=UPI0023E2A63F|nr:uncharacterized protein LOC128994435 isoform X1 [Macrosteles quadrilineatus]
MKLLIQGFLAVLLLTSETFASFEIPSDDSDLTKSILEENPSSGVQFYSDSDSEEETSVKSYSDTQLSDSYGQPPAEPYNEHLSVLDVILRKRRTEASVKPEEKVLDFPRADNPPIKDYASEYISSNNPPSIQGGNAEKASKEERPHLKPILFKIESSTNRDDSVAKDKQLEDDKPEEESVKIILNPLIQASP